MSISIAIPNSCLADEATNLDKSRKISLIARTCAIFKIDTIYIYYESENQDDTRLLVTILKYLDTPQYLRKKLYPKMNELKYAGILAPLKIPSHLPFSNPKKIRDGDTRDGLVVFSKGKKYVDVGINFLIPYFGTEKSGKRITVQFKKGYPDFVIKEIPKNSVGVYWGYSVKERKNLSDFLLSWSGSIILTSRKGKVISSVKLNLNDPVLVVFGTTDKGIHEILGNKIKSIQNSKVLNFFPNQATETVRLEEAILGTLSILNVLKN